MRIFLAALLAAFLFSSPTSAQSATRFYPGEAFRPMWNYTKECSDVSILPGGNYEDVKWFAFLPGERGLNILGSWIAPDTIYIDITWLQSAWIVQHELLHHLLRGPPEEPHPWRPFAFPCRLMPFQNLAGGIMHGSEHRYK